MDTQKNNKKTKKYLITGTLLLFFASLVIAYFEVQQRFSDPPKQRLAEISEKGVKDVVIEFKMEQGPYPWTGHIGPSYTLTIHGDGRVIFKIFKGPVHIKTRTAKISEDKIRALLEEFDRVNFFALKDSEKVIPVSDFPMNHESISISHGERSKTVSSIGYGIPSGKISGLSIKIIEIANADQWIREL